VWLVYQTCVTSNWRASLPNMCGLHQASLAIICNLPKEALNGSVQMAVLESWWSRTGQRDDTTQCQNRNQLDWFFFGFSVFGSVRSIVAADTWLNAHIWLHMFLANIDAYLATICSEENILSCFRVCLDLTNSVHKCLSFEFFSNLHFIHKILWILLILIWINLLCIAL
jgi:hypothetical protein